MIPSKPIEHQLGCQKCKGTGKVDDKICNLCHGSGDGFVKDIREVIHEGDIIKVKVVNIDNQGRINLSKKQAE